MNKITYKALNVGKHNNNYNKRRRGKKINN